MDLDLLRVIKSVPAEHEKQELTQLFTPWGEALNAEDPFPEHPRPQFARELWASLCGSQWEYAIVDSGKPNAVDAVASAKAPDAWDGSIVVPFSPEAALSGVGRQLQPNELLWYKRVFHVAPSFGRDLRTVLHFDGVDYACAVYVNGTLVAEHKGAYTPFEADITELVFDEENELLVCVADPSETGTQLRGKQRIDRGDMWYTAQSGMFKPVWLERMPAAHIASLQVSGDPDTGELACKVWLANAAIDSAWKRGTPQTMQNSDGVRSGDGDSSLRGLGGTPFPCSAEQPPFTCEVIAANGITVASTTLHPAEGVGVVEFTLAVPEPHAWSPTDPYLYQLRLTFDEDEVRSYAAFRSIAVQQDAQGIPRLFLNGKPLFVRGLLDQGYWPDGLLTPPSDEAYVFDIQTAKDAGFNALRKHIKIETDRYYYHCDRLGMLVLQDMPSGGSELNTRYSRDLPTLFARSWHFRRDTTPADQANFAGEDQAYQAEWRDTTRDAIWRLHNHPCIITWALFNESWGQFCAVANTELVRELDPSRPILSCSGWYDQGAGDLRGIHNYFRTMHTFGDPFAKRGEPGRAEMLSEFGGLGWHIDGHSALEREYGYAQFESHTEWRHALASMLAQVDALQAEGLTGFIYTQISDVEEETNGLLTCDRKVNKLQL